MSLSRFFSQNMMKNTKLLFCPDFSFHIWIVRRDVISSSGEKSTSFNLIEISLVSSISYLGVCIIFKLRTCFYKHRNVWLSFFLSLRYRRHLASLQRGRMSYHCLSHLVPIWLQVQLVQALLDALSGGTGALWEQHTEVMHKILQRERRQVGVRKIHLFWTLCVCHE